MTEQMLAVLVEAGGLLAFAAVVYFELRRQTAVLKTIGEKIVVIVERQALIMDRQQKIRDDLAKNGVEIRELPGDSAHVASN